MTLILILVTVGLLAILAELVLPGGLLGIVGALCLIGAVINTYLTYGITAGTIGLVILLVLGIATLGWWMKYFHRLPFTKQLILSNESGTAEKDETPAIGASGIALTDLVPSGHARIDGIKYDVMAEAAQIPKGTPVEVVAKRGPSLIVRLVSES